MRMQKWSDEPDDMMLTCIICGSPSWKQNGLCDSEKCAEEEQRIIDNTGTCAWCGRYGKLGEPCFRMLDGQMEECGQFL